MQRLTWLLVLLACLMPGARGHEVTFSRIDIYLEAERTEVQLSLPILALTFEEPSSLPSGTTDAVLQTDPLPQDVQAAIQQLVSTRMLFRSNGNPLPFALSAVTPAGMDVSLTAIAPAAHGLIEVDANLFPADLLNKAFVSVYAAGEIVGQYALDRTNHVFEMEGVEPPLFRRLQGSLVDGILAFLSRPEHALTLIALLLLPARKRDCVAVAACFIGSQWVALGLSSTGQFSLPLAQLSVAMAIVVIALAALDLWFTRPGSMAFGTTIRTLALIGLLSGAIQGFYFAGTSASQYIVALMPPWELAAFIFGSFAVQAIVVAAILIVRNLMERAGGNSIALARIVAFAILIAGPIVTYLAPIP
jgi:hypothetical protein